MITGGGGGAAQAYQFPVSAYGAKGDGVTDDTAAIQAAINAATTYARANKYYAEVLFEPLSYLIAGALATTQSGYSQIQLPYLADGSTQKMTTLALVCIGAAMSESWAEASQVIEGTTFISTNTSAGYSSSFGNPSVLGGPTAEQIGSQVYSAMHLKIKGTLSFSLPMPPDNGHGIGGLDARHLAGVDIEEFRASSTGTYHSATRAVPAYNGMFGLAMPINANYNRCRIGRYYAAGLYAGVWVSEHTAADNLAIHQCVDGIGVYGAYSHGAHIRYASVEWCTNSVQSSPSTNGGANERIIIDMLDLEDAPAGGSWVPTAHIADAGDYLLGDINFLRVLSGTGDVTGLTVNGGTGLRLRDLSRPPGNVAAPAIPASATAYTNPFYRDAAVNISGGTVTAITVAGASTGLTSGTVIVPANKSIALTYSVAPAWTWTLL